MRTNDADRVRRAWRRRLALTLCTIVSGPCFPPYCDTPHAAAARPAATVDSADDARTAPAAELPPAAVVVVVEARTG
jgi:hypothetical protein